MAVRLVSRFDGDLDLVVRGSLALHLGGLDGLLLADSASGGVEAGKAGQKSFVVLALALLALAKAMKPVDQIWILPGRLVGSGDIGLVAAGEPAPGGGGTLFGGGSARRRRRFPSRTGLRTAGPAN